MMIRSKLKLLTAGAVFVVVLTAIVTWLEHLTIQKQNHREDAVEQLQTEAVNLNIITIDLLHDAQIRIQSKQWLIIYNNLGKKITDSPLHEQTTYPILKKQHQKIGQRFNTYIQAHENCQQKKVTKKSAVYTTNSCHELQRRLGNQIRLAQQDLLVEIHKIHQRLGAQSRRQDFIGGMLLLALPLLMLIFIAVLVLPVTRSLNTGLTRLLKASERFSRGDFGYRLDVDGHDEMAILATTYNTMAQRREEAEKLLRKTEKNLSHSQKMDAIGQLTGGIAHDFNNLLCIIQGNLELLERQTAGDDKAHKRIENIQNSTQRAADLTSQLLGFSRRQAEHVTVTNINQIIQEMENLISRSVTPQVEVQLHFAENLWLTAIDTGDFQDTLINLVLNARDAMSGRGQLTLETQNCYLDAAYCSLNPGANPGEYVQLAVSDNGEGMSGERQNRIFEPFFTTKAQGKGTGLGLAMVFGFIKRCKGHIKVYSEPNIGTTFRIYLPKAEAENLPDKQTKIQTGKLPRGIETLLAVDDEADLLELAKESLQEQGYRVITATNGNQALEKLTEEPSIKLLFSDIVMPGGINGYELAEQATRQYPELKVLLTSGYTEKSVAHNGQARFNANLLSKPYSQAELIQQVRALLDEPV